MQLAKFGDPQYQRREYVPYQPQLGLIPAWQYSSDPGVNIKLNPNVKFPPGWSQMTVQSQGQTVPGMGGLHDSVFDSWAWANRKWLVLGGVGLLGSLGLVATVALLR